MCDHKEEIIESLSRELESLREEGETLKKREAVMVAENNSNCQVCSLRQLFLLFFLQRKIITCTLKDPLRILEAILGRQTLEQTQEVTS